MEKLLIPKRTPQLTLICRLVDDQFIIFIPTNNTPAGNEIYDIPKSYKRYRNNINTITSLTSDTVKLLELTINILPNGNLSFQTYQNTWNIYLCLPVHPPRPPGTLC